MWRTAVDELRAFVRAALWQPVAGQTPDQGGALVRRRAVVAVVLVIGVALLTWTLRIRPGDPLFYPVGFALAGVWAVGALASGPVRMGRATTRRGATVVPIVQPLVMGLLLLAVFLLGAVMVGFVPPLRAPVEALLDKARYASLPVVLLITVVNGVAEELFFRGALQPAVPQRWAVPVTTAIYTATTLGSGVPLLVFAAFVLGLVTGLQRRVTGGVLGPIITHITWSAGMLLLLPSVFGAVNRLGG